MSDKFTLEIINTDASRRPEKIKMINHLKENGCIVACFTNSIRRTAQLMLEKTGVLDSLDKLLTNEDVKNPKPSPEGYDFLVNHFLFRLSLFVQKPKHNQYQRILVLFLHSAQP